MDFLFSYKPLVDSHLERFLQHKEKELSPINQWGHDAIQRLMHFVAGGKTIRGSLLLYSYLLFQKSSSTFVMNTAAALEFFQSGFLIHDDIMDQDATRRGKQSIHKQYEQFAQEKGGQNEHHFGTSMGINIADLCFFLGYELLGGLPEKYSHTVQIVSREFSSVVTAQMQDVSVTHLSTQLNKTDILSLYRYKTARYSFFVPLGIGALLADANDETISKLEKLGESMGILFQIRDDELARSTQSDKRNQKQTLASVMSQEELDVFKAELVQKSNNSIDELLISENHKKELAALVAFCQNREA